MRCFWPLPLVLLMPTAAPADDARQKEAIAVSWIDLAEHPDNTGYGILLGRTKEEVIGRQASQSQCRFLSWLQIGLYNGL